MIKINEIIDMEFINWLFLFKLKINSMKLLRLTTMLWIGFLLVLISPLRAQEEETKTASSISINADLVSRYMWRGLLLSPSPNLQPYVTFEKGNFSVGSWGSYSLTDFFAEADLFMSYSLGDVTLTVTDYFSVSDTLPSYGYFDWKKSSTTHTLEGTVGWTVSEKFPLSITASTMFYGYDQDTTGTPFYSSYIEASYPVSIGENTLNFFAGFTPAEGYYSEKAGFVNLGLKAGREIKISDGFTLPLNLTFAVNPSAKRVFLVAAFTF
jgi:hypothetical protein